MAKGIVENFYSLASPCKICPHNCNVNRKQGEKGVCKTGFYPMISAYQLHMGEEDVLVGNRGSGTIFFTGCNLKCKFCQNYGISQEMNGRKITVEELSDCMLELQNNGALNINLVTPTHQIHVIVHAIFVAKAKGLNLPIVYNCGGYESVETLKLLQGIVDIYMPDAKYSKKKSSLDFSGAEDYFEKLKSALHVMHNQVGDLILDSRGVAKRGLLVRHLVMPGGLYGLAGAKQILDFIAYEITKNTYVNIMAQYRPCYKAHQYPESIGRRLLISHYLEVKDYAKSIGLTRGLE